jgi:hypothetical protein
MGYIYICNGIHIYMYILGYKGIIFDHIIIGYYGTLTDDATMINHILELASGISMVHEHSNLKLAQQKGYGQLVSICGSFP